MYRRIDRAINQYPFTGSWRANNSLATAAPPAQAETEIGHCHLTAQIYTKDDDQRQYYNSRLLST